MGVGVMVGDRAETLSAGAGEEEEGAKRRDDGEDGDDYTVRPNRSQHALFIKICEADYDCCDTLSSPKIIRLHTLRCLQTNTIVSGTS